MALSSNKWLVALLLLSVAVGLATAHRRFYHDHDDDDDERYDDDNDSGEHDDDHDDDGSFWRSAGGIVLLVLLCVGLIVAFLLLVCLIQKRCSSTRVNDTATVMFTPGKTAGVVCPPEWSRSLSIKPELGFGFGLMSEGFYSQLSGHLLRQRTGSDVTDGAKWAMPLVSGKHLFEVVWPWGCRGSEATVGVATRHTPLKVEASAQLVGRDAHSWGLDIVRRKVIHNGETVRKCPTDGSYVPDRFLMFIDCDEGTVGFGNDVTFWGNVITGLPKGEQLFPMVGANKWGANIQMVYKGTHDAVGFDPFITRDRANALPPLSGGMPTYEDLFNASGSSRPGSKAAWEPMPPTHPHPSEEASAPREAPPPYASPEPPRY